MADIFINELPLFTGNTQGVYLIINNSGETETFKVTKETLIGNIQDIYVTGFTYDNLNTFTITDNYNNNFSATINTVTGLTVNGTISATTYDNLPPAVFSGGTVSGPTTFTNGLTASTISATTYFNLPIKVSVDFGFDSTYATTSSTFAQIPLNVVVQSASTYNSTYTGMTATLICDISESDTGITGEFELYDVTNLSSIVGSTTSFVDTDGLKSSSSFTITSSDFDDTFRVRIRRTSGTGTDNVRIRSAQLLLTLV